MGEHFELSELEDFMSSWIGLIYSTPAARGVWANLVGSVVSFSNTRWYCKAEIIMQIATNFPFLEQAIANFDEKGIGQAHRARLRKLLGDHKETLQLRFASAMLDMRLVVATTCDLEGNRLEILLAHDCIEVLRQQGRSLKNGGLPLTNVDGLLRQKMKIEIGTTLKKEWPSIGMFKGKVTAEYDDLVSTIYPDGRGEVKGYGVTYEVDGTTEDLQEDEIRKWLIIDAADPTRKSIVEGLGKGFDYLEDKADWSSPKR
ncbi:MAG: hypothetical protein SGPRY_002160 [Prymnesium sp.]